MERSLEQRIARALADLQQETPRPLRTREPASLAQQMRSYATPGGSISVVQDCEVVAELGFGVRRAGTNDAVTSTTLFQAGSISKPVFAMAVMRLVSSGVLDLDADVNDYLTSWRVPDSGGWTPRITLRQLLRHSAATSIHGFPGYPAAGPWPTVREVLDGASPANTLPVVVEGIPGLHVRYSGGGTTIAQLVVTDVVGKPFSDLMRELVLEPAGMSNSTFEQPLPAAIAERAASGHPWNGVPVTGGWHVYPEMAAAGLWTTAGDLARLGAQLMRTLNGAESALGLSPETVAAMLRPQVPGIKIGDEFPGLGWFCSGEGEAFRFGHGGQDEGFIAHMRMFPELGAGAVVMINSVQGWPLPGEILAAIGREFDWPSVSDERTQVTVEEIGRFSGAYRDANGMTVEVRPEGSNLSLIFEGQKPIPPQAVSETEFASDTLDLKAIFAPGKRNARSSLEVRHLGSVLRFDRAGEGVAGDRQKPVRSQELAVIRRAYAKQVLASVSVEDQCVEDAFATVLREDFLGPGPWPILRWRGYVTTPDDDPTYLYSDVLVGILPGRGLNNGMPSYHAPLMSKASIREGEHVVHVGAGTGYYTKILARLVGEAGRVTAIEFDPELAQRATANLATMANARVIEGDGAVVPFDAADVIYVNAGATRPADRWLDGLAEGGRLILPLTATKTLSRKNGRSIERHGAVFRIERRGDDLLAHWISPVGVYPCEGGRDDASESALDAALQKGGWEAVTRLYRSDDLPEERCWLRAPGWCLAYE